MHGKIDKILSFHLSLPSLRYYVTCTMPHGPFFYSIKTQHPCFQSIFIYSLSYGPFADANALNLSNCGWSCSILKEVSRHPRPNTILNLFCNYSFVSVVFCALLFLLILVQCTGLLATISTTTLITSPFFQLYCLLRSLSRGSTYWNI